jgi:hypothetical protein
MLRRSSEQFSAGYLYRAARFHPMSVVLLVIVSCAWFCSQDTFLTRYLSNGTYDARNSGLRDHPFKGASNMF